MQDSIFPGRHQLFLASLAYTGQWREARLSRVAVSGLGVCWWVASDKRAKWSSKLVMLKRIDELLCRTKTDTSQVLAYGYDCLGGGSEDMMARDASHSKENVRAFLPNHDRTRMW